MNVRNIIDVFLIKNGQANLSMMVKKIELGMFLHVHNVLNNITNSFSYMDHVITKGVTIFQHFVFDFINAQY
jgi:hypothetical protein